MQVGGESPPFRLSRGDGQVTLRGRLRCNQASGLIATRNTTTRTTVATTTLARPTCQSVTRIVPARAGAAAATMSVRRSLICAGERSTPSRVVVGPARSSRSAMAIRASAGTATIARTASDRNGSITESLMPEPSCCTTPARMARPVAIGTTTSKPERAHRPARDRQAQGHRRQRPQHGQEDRRPGSWHERQRIRAIGPTTARMSHSSRRDARSRWARTTRIAPAAQRAGIAVDVVGTGPPEVAGPRAHAAAPTARYARLARIARRRSR